MSTSEENWTRKMDGNNNNRITGGSPNSNASPFNFPISPSFGGGAGTAAHDMNLAQILYYQNLLKQQSSAASKMQARGSAVPQYTVINNPSILPQVPGSPTNRSFAAALRNLAKQIGPGPSTSPEHENNVAENDNRQASPKARVSSSLLRNSSPTPLTAKSNEKEKTISANTESRSGFQPYRPDETRSALASSQPTAPTPPNPYGLDPAAAAAYSPYHAAAAAAAAAAAFYPPHMQHAYRIEEQLYLERCGLPMFSPSPYPSPLYGMMPAALGLMSPAIHERLKLEEEQRHRESLERERSEREKREKSKRSPRASPSHSQLPDHSARKAPITTSSSSVNHHQSQSPLPQSSKLSQSSPTSVSQLPSTSAVPFIRPFEDNYASSSHSPSKTKNSFLSSLSDSGQSSALTCAFTPLTATAASKLSNPFECFSTSKTPDSGLVDPPSAHMSSQTVSSYLSATTPELTSFPSASSNSASNSPSFKPFSTYPYDLIQYPPFKNHMIGHMALSPPLPKKPRTITGSAANESVAKSEQLCGRASKSSRANAKPRSKIAKSTEKKKTSICASVNVGGDTNSIPLNLSTNVTTSTTPPNTNCIVDKILNNDVDNITETTLCDTVKSNVVAKDETSTAFTVAAETEKFNIHVHSSPVKYENSQREDLEKLKFLAALELTTHTKRNEIELKILSKRKVLPAKSSFERSTVFVWHFSSASASDSSPQNGNESFDKKSVNFKNEKNVEIRENNVDELPASSSINQLITAFTLYTKERNEDIAALKILLDELNVRIRRRYNEKKNLATKLQKLRNENEFETTREIQTKVNVENFRSSIAYQN